MAVGGAERIVQVNQDRVISSIPEDSATTHFNARSISKPISGGPTKRRRRAESESSLSKPNTTTMNEVLTLRKSHSAMDVQHRERGEEVTLTLSFDQGRLDHQLSVAMETEPLTRHEFLPRGALESLVTQKAVDQELSKVDYLPKRIKHCPWWPATNVRIGSVEEHENLRHMQTVSAHTVMAQSDRLCFQQVLAILLLMGRPKKIWYFVKERVSDADLPLVRMDRDKISELQRRDESQTTVRCLKRHRDVRDFATRQWCVLAPFFGDSDKETISHHVIQKGQILPFVHWEHVCRQGGSGQVHKAEIHPDHHAFDKNEVCVSLPFCLPDTNLSRYTTMWLQ
jgi:hypothetical protein